MKLIEVIMQHLGVEENEKFNLITNDTGMERYNPYYFSSGELFDDQDDSEHYGLQGIISGIYTIEKILPKVVWDIYTEKPNKGDKYYFVHSFSRNDTADTWKNTIDENYLYENKILHKTAKSMDLEAQQIMIEVQLRREIAKINNGWVPDWKDETQKKILHSSKKYA